MALTIFVSGNLAADEFKRMNEDIKAEFDDNVRLLRGVEQADARERQILLADLMVIINPNENAQADSLYALNLGIEQLTYSSTSDALTGDPSQLLTDVKAAIDRLGQNDSQRVPKPVVLDLMTVIARKEEARDDFEKIISQIKRLERPNPQRFVTKPHKPIAVVAPSELREVGEQIVGAISENFPAELVISENPASVAIDQYWAVLCLNPADVSAPLIIQTAPAEIPVIPILLDPVDEQSPLHQRPLIAQRLKIGSRVSFVGDFSQAVARLITYLAWLCTAFGKLFTQKQALDDLQQIALSEEQPLAIVVQAQAAITEIENRIRQSAELLHLSKVLIEKPPPAPPSNVKTTKHLSRRQQRQQYADQKAAEWYSQLEELTRFSEGEKSRLRRSMKDKLPGLTFRQAFNFNSEKDAYIFTAVMLACLIGAFVFGVSYSGYKLPSTIEGWSTIITFFVIGQLIAVLITMFPIIFSAFTNLKYLRTMYWLLWWLPFWCLLDISALIRLHEAGWFASGYLFLISSAFMGQIFMTIGFLMPSIITLTQMEGTNRRYAVEVITYELVKALHILQTNPNALQEEMPKRYLIYHLENAANRAEVSVATQLRIVESQVIANLKSEANKLRTHIQQIENPAADTPIELQDPISNWLRGFVFEKNWLYVPENPIPVPRVEPSMPITAVPLRLLVAIVPFAIIAWFGSIGIALLWLIANAAAARYHREVAIAMQTLDQARMAPLPKQTANLSA